MNPILALIIVNVIWGAAAPVFKYALFDIPPFTFLFIRFFFAALIFFPAAQNADLTKLNKQDWLEIFLGTVMGFTIHIGFLFIGLGKTESINSSIILIGSPILLILLNRVLFHQRISHKTLYGMLLSTSGVLLIIFAPLLLEGRKAGLGSFEGNLLYVGSMIGNVVAVLLFKRVSGKISAFTLTFLTFTISAATFFPFMIRELLTWNFDMLGQQGIIGIFYGIFFSSALAYYLYFYGLKKMPETDVEIFGYLNPVITVLVAVPLLHEVPSAYFIVGSVLICFGLLVSEMKLHMHHLRTIKKE